MKRFGKLFAVGLASITIVTGLMMGACGDNTPKDEVTVYMPDGAPALALAELMAKDTQDDGITYRVVDPSTITVKVAGKNPDDNADFCILPVNAASLLLGSGEAYQMLGLVTQGNMYLISSNTEAAEIVDLSALAGETVGVMQIANVPGLTLKAALNRQNVVWRELKGGVTAAENEVNLQGVTGVDGSLKYYLAPEPMVSVLTASGKFRVVGDLQKLYNGADSNQVGYPQAALVAKRDFVSENAAWTKKFVADIAAAGAWLETASAQEIYAAVSSHFEDENHKASFAADKLGKETLARCGISFAYSRDCYLRVDEFLEELTVVDSQKAKTVAKAFYWMP